MRSFSIGNFIIETKSSVDEELLKTLVVMLQSVSDRIFDIKFSREIEVLNSFFCLLFNEPVGFSIDIREVNGSCYWVQNWCVCDPSDEDVMLRFYTSKQIHATTGREFSKRLYKSLNIHDKIEKRNETKSREAYSLIQNYVYYLNGQYVYQEKEIVMDKIKKRPKLIDWDYITRAHGECLFYMLAIPAEPNLWIRFKSLFSFGKPMRINGTYKYTSRTQANAY